MREHADTSKVQKVRLRSVHQSSIDSLADETPPSFGGLGGESSSGRRPPGERVRIAHTAKHASSRNAPERAFCASERSSASDRPAFRRFEPAGVCGPHGDACGNG